jgi:hypothetical protein
VIDGSGCVMTAPTELTSTFVTSSSETRMWSISSGLPWLIENSCAPSASRARGSTNAGRPLVRDLEPAGVDLRSGRPEEQLRRRRLDRVVQIATQDNRLRLGCQGGCRPRPQAGRLSGAPVQSVGGEPGSFALVVRLESATREREQLGLQMRGD